VYKLAELVYENMAEEIKNHNITLDKYDELLNKGEKKNAVKNGKAARQPDDSSTAEESKKDK